MQILARGELVPESPLFSEWTHLTRELLSVHCTWRDTSHGWFTGYSLPIRFFGSAPGWPSVRPVIDQLSRLLKHATYFGKNRRVDTWLSPCRANDLFDLMQWLKPSTCSRRFRSRLKVNGAE